MNNFYWPVYKHLENELLELTYQIHFDDRQLSVYSTKLVDLLLRTSIEVESIAKELYLKNNGELIKDRDLYFDTDCMKHINNLWNICEKEVSIIALNTFFTDINKTFKPLKNTCKRGKSKWIRAYQDVKHDRSKKLEKATLKNCILALGSLYILNLYLLDNNYIKNLTLDNFGSHFFSPKQKYVSFEMPSGKYVNNYDDCIFLQVYSNSIYNEALKQCVKEGEIMAKAMLESKEYKQFLIENPTYSFENKNIVGICLDIGGIEYARKIRKCCPPLVSNIIKSPTHIVLNKNQQIYTKEF